MCSCALQSKAKAPVNSAINICGNNWHVSFQLPHDHPDAHEYARHEHILLGPCSAEAMASIVLPG